MAAGAGLLVLILLGLGVRGCLNSRKETAYKDYVRDVSALVQESNQQGQALFKVLTARNQDDVRVTNSLNAFARDSELLVDRARTTDRPDELARAQTYLVETLELRRDGVKGIATRLPAAIPQGQDRKEGTARIAVDMQSLLASDVIYLQRVVPAIQGALKDQGLAGQESVPRSEFLPDVEWLQPSTVADRIGSLGGGGGGSDKAATPGLHGTALAGVTLGGQTLAPGGSASIKLAGDLTFTVQVSNGGENTETDVDVEATIGTGGDAIKLKKTLDTIAAGETKPVEIPLGDMPPTGQNVPITVKIAKVPGETKTDNNEGKFSAIFTR